MVRRIDDLGRIVIPKEVRRTLRINNGDPLELYIDGSGNIVFKKYSLLGEINKLMHCICDAFYKVLNIPTIICNNDQVICSSGISKKECIGRRVNTFSVNKVQFSERFVTIFSDNEHIKPVEGLEKEAIFIIALKVQDKNIGYVIALKNATTTGMPFEYLEITTKLVSELLCNFLM